jgi:CHAT domain-containing protein
LAFSDPDSALESCVYLTESPGFDGRLTADEIQNALPPSTIDLVFLSACQTALGASPRADATIGLPRALLSTGARTVVASMWNLEDSSTAFLVRRFYHHLLHDTDRPTVARALHLAMVETAGRKDKPEWRDPYFWAAFQVVGGY